MVADDRVGPGRIDDGDLTQEIVGIPLLQYLVSPPLLDGLVGVTPSSAMSAPSNALTNADLPELNSPTMTSKNNSSRSWCARWTRSMSSEGAPKSLRKDTSFSRSSRSRSTSASRRSSSIRTPYTSLCIQALYTPDGFAVPRSW